MRTVKVKTKRIQKSTDISTIPGAKSSLSRSEILVTKNPMTSDEKYQDIEEMKFSHQVLINEPFTQKPKYQIDYVKPTMKNQKIVELPEIIGTIETPKNEKNLELPKIVKRENYGIQISNSQVISGLQNENKNDDIEEFVEEIKLEVKHETEDLEVLESPEVSTKIFVMPAKCPNPEIENNPKYD